ncbi:MAG: EamA family transporter [Acidobacteriota bacterium]|nr:EamA family transporter [Acidobacteriota bacterium]MDH3524409.1 EamA family transporter [Acidobacteriota bacterium]
MTEAQRLRLTHAAAFAAVYLIWGSTYLAIRFAIETLPGFLMAGVRFVAAGLALYAIAAWRGAARPTRAQWRSAAIAAAFLFVGGNGGVVFAQHWIPSGLAALIVAVEPLWVVVLLTFWGGGSERPSRRTVVALAIGFAGAAILARPQDSIGLVAGDAGRVPALALAAILVSPLAWAAGSLYARDADMPDNRSLGVAMQMIAGGVGLVLVGLAAGEAAEVDLAAASGRSLAALLYLVVFGSIIAFSAYSWLLRNTRATLVSTYAYVNPVIAVFLGWLLAGEPIGAATVVATALIIGAVVLVGMEARRSRRRLPPTPPAPPASGGSGSAAP